MSTLPNEVILAAVRLSFPNLFVAKSVNGGEPQFSATLLLDKEQDAEQIKACRVAMTNAARDKWGAKIPSIPPDRLALRDGSTKPDMDGYGDGVMYVSANSKKAIPVVDKNPSVVLTRESTKIYAGCYVNAKVRFWAQDNQWGKRVNAQLIAVQFVADGDPFGEAPVKPDEVFDNIDDGSGDANPFGDAGGGEDSSGLLG